MATKWGQTVLDARGDMTHPTTIDGMPMWEYVAMVRGEKPKEKVKPVGPSPERSRSPLQMLVEGNKDQKYTQALSDKLRYRQDMGEFLALAGNKDMSEFGDSLRNDVLGQQQQKEKQDYRYMVEDQYAAGNEHQGNVLKETITHNRAMEDYYRNRDTAQNRMREKDFSTNVRKLSEKMTDLGIPELQYDVGRVSDSLAPYLKEDGKDIPGIGKTGMVPNIWVSDEGVKIRQGLASVRNKLLRVRSGAAVTDPEMSRFADELITTMDTISGDRELMLTWPEIAAGVAQIEKGIMAGYDDEVKNVYHSRMGEEGPDDPEEVGPVSINEETGNPVNEW